MLTSAVAKMRSMLLEMEKDLGIAELSEAQRDVLYAITLLSAREGIANIDEIQGHELTQLISRPTLFRAINSLLEKNIIVRVGTERSGKYQVV